MNGIPHATMQQAIEDILRDFPHGMDTRQTEDQADGRLSKIFLTDTTPWSSNRKGRARVIARDNHPGRRIDQQDCSWHCDASIVA